jgi:hypothetical protein
MRLERAVRESRWTETGCTLSMRSSSCSISNVLSASVYVPGKVAECFTCT